MSTGTRAFRSVDRDGDGIPDEPQVFAALKGAGAGVASRLKRKKAAGDVPASPTSTLSRSRSKEPTDQRKRRDLADPVTLAPAPDGSLTPRSVQTALQVRPVCMRPLPCHGVASRRSKQGNRNRGKDAPGRRTAPPRLAGCFTPAWARGRCGAPLPQDWISPHNPAVMSDLH